MEDLAYIISLGFSGSDVARAIILSFLLAMFVSSKRPIALLATIGFLIDQLVWPLAGQATSGAELQSVFASIGAIFASLLDNLGVYVVRFIGLFLMIAGFAFMRVRLHGVLGGKTKPA